MRTKIHTTTYIDILNIKTYIFCIFLFYYFVHVHIAVMYFYDVTSKCNVTPMVMLSING